MIAELDLLRVLLLFSLALGPLGTHRHFAVGSPRARTLTHLCALLCATVGVFAAPLLCVVWLVFCAASFALFLRAHVAALRSPRVLAACVPFLFSNIAAVWLVAGANDLHLLGYGTAFSYYAALHGNVLGWILIGALAILAGRDTATETERRIHLAAVLVCLASFLLIAFGIDRLHALKPFGVIGLSLALPVSQLTFLRSTSRRHRAAFALGCVSLAGLVSTMTLAWCNELALPVLGEIAGLRAMVSVHGVINALIVAPSFLLAVVLDTPPRTGSA